MLSRLINNPAISFFDFLVYSPFSQVVEIKKLSAEHLPQIVLQINNYWG